MPQVGVGASILLFPNPLASLNPKPYKTQMVASLEDFLAQRLREIDAQIAALDAQYRSVEDERKQLEKAGRAVGLNHLFDYNADHAAAQEAVEASARRSGKVASERTIKEAVVEILKEMGHGLSALDILAAINKRFGFEYPRTSLSPQLSRLKAAGQLERNGLLWTLAEEEEEDDEADNAIDATGSEDEAADAKPTQGTSAASVQPEAQGREAGPGGGG